MAKKRKDLTGQLDGLFSDFDAEEEAQAEEEKLDESQIVADLVEAEQAEPSPVEPAAVEPTEVSAETPAIDALLAAEPAVEAAEEAKQPEAEQPEAEPAQVEPAEVPAETPAIDDLLAAEPVVAEEVEQPELASVEPEVIEQAGPAEAEHEVSEPVELPTMAELLAAEEVEPAKPALAEEALPAVVAEATEEAEVEPEMERVVWEVVQPAPPSAPPAWEVEIQEKRTRILNILLVAMSVVATIIVSTLVIFSLSDPDLWITYLPFFVAWVVLLGLNLFRGLSTTLRTTILVVLAYVAGIFSLYIDGPLGAGGMYLLLAPILFSVLVQQRAGICAAIFSFITYVSFTIAHHLGWIVSAEVLDVARWEVVMNLSSTFFMLITAVTLLQWLFNSSLLTSLREVEEKHTAAVRSQDALRERAEELAVANEMLRRRSLQLETASQVSQAASSILDPEELMQQVVDLIQERFGLYYVGLFLSGEEGAGAGGVVLRAGTGEAGRRMLARGYGVEIGDDSAVGQCTARGQAHIVLDATLASGEPQPNPSVELGGEDGYTGHDLLPRTRSEIAMPLRSRGRVLGALDAHSAESGAFSQEDIAILQAMADNIAVTIDNARLFAELRRRLEEMEASQRLYVREQWSELVPRRVKPVYQRTSPEVVPLDGTVLSEVEKMVAQQKVLVQSDGDGGTDQAAVVTPVTLRGEVIGALGLQEAQGKRQWAEDEIALIEAVADQMALAIENVRLLEETRQLAGWEQTLSDMTARFTRSLDTETLLQTAIQELGQLLQVDEVSVHIGVPGEPAPAGEYEGTGNG